MMERLTEREALQMIEENVRNRKDLADCFSCKVCPYIGQCNATYNCLELPRRDHCRIVLTEKFFYEKEGK